MNDFLSLFDYLKLEYVFLLMALSNYNLYRNEVVNCAPHVGYLISGEALD